MRNLLLLLAACAALAGCATSANFTNPADGKTASCTGGLLSDIYVWGNYPLCLEQYTSAGYQRVR
jgi:uncharacterized protein YceK